MIYILDVLIAFVLDLIFGDPQQIPHPIRFIGSLISKTEGFLRKIAERFSNSSRAERICGCLLCGFVVLFVFMFVFILLYLAAKVNQVLFHILNIYIIYSSLAARCLADEAKKVYHKLKSGTLDEARVSLSWLVGRDTSALSEDGVIRGVIETTAENTVDAVISPLFYALIGSAFGLGAPIVYAFKAVSTLDSMVGYKNDKYRYMGTASARLDDVLNFIPARLSIIFIPLAAALLGMNGLPSFKTALRDRKKHLSPNSAHSESAVAGALGVRLGGPNVYFGKIIEKPYLGDPVKDIDAEDIIKTNKIMYLSSVLTVAAFVPAAVYLTKFLVSAVF